MDSSGQEKKTAAQTPSEIAQNLKVADENVTFKYDESARNIVAQKSVLAYILKSALDEYAAYTVQEIAERFIEVFELCNLSAGVYNKGYDSGISVGKMEQAKSTTYKLYDKGMSCEEIADMVEVDPDTVREWLAEREEMFVK